MKKITAWQNNVIQTALSHDVLILSKNNSLILGKLDCHFVDKNQISVSGIIIPVEDIKVISIQL